MNLKKVTITDPLHLESGETLQEITIAYSSFGELNQSKNNVIWVFHALTANSNPTEWWAGLVGNNDLFTPEKYFIICANVLGSCYGTTGPDSEEIHTTKQGLNFPLITVKDVVKAHELLAEKLEIKEVEFAIGGSFGGYQAIEFSLGKVKVNHLIAIATSTIESPWNIAIHETQRMALFTDPTISHLNGGKKGLETARGIGILSYRTPESFITSQPRKKDQVDNFKASSYINYQGQKLSKRFSAHAYLTLIYCLDTHDIGRHRGGLQSALKQIQSKTLFIGIEEDVLACSKALEKDCKEIKKGSFELINSQFGHDGFLLETKKITQLIKKHFHL